MAAVDENAVDLPRFEAGVVTVRQAAAAERLTDEAEQFRAAVALWRGCSIMVDASNHVDRHPRLNAAEQDAESRGAAGAPAWLRQGPTASRLASGWPAVVPQTSGMPQRPSPIGLELCGIVLVRHVFQDS